MAKVTVKAGICGFVAVIEANKNEDEMIDVKFKTTCPNFKAIEAELDEVDGMTCCFEKIGEGEIYDMFKAKCPHITCPIPCGVLKAIELAEGLALPKNVEMIIEK